MSSKDYSHEGSLQRSSLQRSTTAGNAENPNLSAVKRTDTSTSLPCTTSQNKRLHDMLHIHRHHNDHSRTVDDSSTKLSRTQTSKDEYTPNSPHPSGSPMKAASALLHGIKSKTSNIYGLGHNRSTSAIERIASKTPGLRSSPFASTSGSRHESDINVDSSGNEVSNTIQQRVRPITVHDVLRERQHNEIRSEEVQEVYMTIKNKARDAEGRLEDVFGELQAKAKILRENIGELQVLVREATSLKRDFTAESGKIEEDFEQKIKAFEGLVEHKNKIEECERKIHEGKQRAKAASERLETARLTVEDWEKREEEWQRKMSSECIKHLIYYTLN